MYTAGSKYFQTRIRRYGKIKGRLEVRRLWLSAFRVLAFTGIIIPPVASYYLLTGDKLQELLLTFPGIILFAWVLRLYGKISAEIRKIESLLAHFREGENRIQGDFTRRKKTYTPDNDEDHPFASDLNLFGEYSLHSMLDRCLTESGSKKLADSLSGQIDWSLDPDAYEQQKEAVREFQRRRILRSRLVRASSIIKEGEGESQALLDLDKKDIPAMPSPVMFVSRLLPPITFISIVLFTAFDIPPYFMLTIPAQFLLYMVGVFYWGKTALYFDRAVESLELSARLFNIIHDSAFRSRLLDDLPAVREKPGKILGRLAFSGGLFQLRRNPLIHFPLGVITLFEFYAMGNVIACIADWRGKISGWMENLAKIDTLFSLGVYSDESPGLVEAELITEGSDIIRGDCVNHPLIPLSQRIPNPVHFSLDEIRLMLITGSNMSGKSTYLRTIGSCLVLAGIGCPVPAKMFAFRPVRIFTSMQQKDDLQHSVSLFYSEVRRLSSLLAQLDVNDPRPVLFIVDEMLRGTNNRERFIASRHVIRKLYNRGAFGLVATHDLELSALCKDESGIHCYHFSELSGKEGLHFDYLIKSGPVTTSNALKILRSEGIDISLEED